MAQLQGLEEVVCHSPFHRETCIEQGKGNVWFFFFKEVNEYTF